jgi:hypothetical protein
VHPYRERQIILSDVLLKLKPFELGVQPCFESPDAEGEWISATALSAPEADPLASLQRRFCPAGFKFNRRAAAGALMLRYGRSAGFAIAAYLTQSRVPFVRDYAVWFSSGRPQLRWLWVGDVKFVGHSGDELAGQADWIESASGNLLLPRLLDSLVALAEPVIATQHNWSGFSRHALWAMVTSSWASQFASIGRQLGDEARAIQEAGAMFELFPEIARAAPEIYAVSGGGRVGTFQKMRACCLYFKNSDRHYCSNCPIIPEDERLNRNRAWLATQ